jgi:ubiquinone/menaquinone biosynthesis C-methylase UbiE
VLDVGCGRDFAMAQFLAARCPKVHGIDPVAAGPVKVPGVSLVAGSAESLPYADGTFDLVTSRSVIEHLPEPAKVFREIRRVLRPGGALVFLTPSKYDYISLASRVVPSRFHGAIVKSLEGREEADTFPTYYRANSARQVRRIADAAGLAVERLEYLNQYPYLLTFSPLLCRMMIYYDRVISRTKGLRWLGASLLGVLRKR